MLSRDPGHAGALHGLARLALRDGRHDLAEALCRKALEGGPRVPAIESTLASHLPGWTEWRRHRPPLLRPVLLGTTVPTCVVPPAASPSNVATGRWRVSSGAMACSSIPTTSRARHCSAIYTSRWANGSPGGGCSPCSAKKLARNPVQRLWGGIDFGGRTVLLFANVRPG